MIKVSNPQDYSLPPHITSWREGQLESVLWGLSLHGTGILSAPVGSGKTGVAKGVSSRKTVIALVQTKLLQTSVYKEHRFDILLGKGNYRCVNGETKFVDTCPYKKMTECLDYPSCAYIKAKNAAMGSTAASLNYAYFLTTNWVQRNPPDVLFMDECHILPEIVLGYIGIGISKRTILEWSLLRPPDIKATMEMDLSPTPSAIKGVIYLRSLLPIINNHLQRLENSKGQDAIRKYSQARRLLENVTRTANLIEQDPSLWFVEGDRSSFRARPLTARYHYRELFNVANSSILMSATVGDFDTLAQELGISSFVSREVPSRFNPKRRPIVALDAPKLSYRSTESDYERQADVIAQAILSFNPTWSGVIHVNKKSAAPDLADRLARKGLQDRIWVTPQVGTDKQLATWNVVKRSRVGPIAIAWAWHEGVDLGDERICINAKIPFGQLGDPYEKARFEYSRAFYAQRAAWSLQQQLGRTRRGREEDYDTDNEVRGLVAIADGNWTRVRKYLSADFVESIVDMKEVI